MENKYQEALDNAWKRQFCDVKDYDTLQELINEYQRLLGERDRLAYELCDVKYNDATKMLEMISKGTTQYYGK